MDMQIQLYSLIGSAPMFLVWGIGLIACARQARNRPKACALTALAIGFAVFTRFLNLAIPFLLAGISDIPLRVLVNSFMHAVPLGISCAIMLWVIFGLKEIKSEQYGQDWRLPT